MLHKRIILFVGHSLWAMQDDIRRNAQPNVYCLFALTGIRGISEACVRVPDVVLCESDDKSCDIYSISSILKNKIHDKNIEYVAVSKNTLPNVLNSLSVL